MTLCVSRLVVALVVILLSAQIAAATKAAENPDAGRIISDDGRVGVGTGKPVAALDVYRGEIKLGASGAACTKELAGALRFTDDQLQVCNSRGWQSIVSDAPKK